jgi:filamentous hemagglutinin
MQLLFDNAVNEQIALNLGVGIELTAAQIAALSSDIIWLVEDVINGQKVLKPVVYLSQATLAAINGEGAKMTTGNNITINASGKMTNAGLIKAGNDIAATVTSDIANYGKIKAGRDISLVSTNGNIINAATVNRGGNGTTSFLDSIGEITAGGNANLNSANDINVIGSKITATNNVTLTAGNDVNIVTDIVHNHTELRAKRHEKTDDTVQNIRSEITAGTDLNLNSDNNTILQAATLDVGTALTEVYDKKGDKRSACGYLKKLSYTYTNKLITNSQYDPKYFYNATGKKFKTLSELIEYYNQKIGCGI